MPDEVAAAMDPRPIIDKYQISRQSYPGCAIGWAMECYQCGIIDKKDTGGLALNWCDADLILELIRMISYREGLGDLLAEGSARAADIIGRKSSYCDMQIKGQDLYEPLRGSLGWALGTTTSTRGGGHTTGAMGDTRQEVNREKAKEVFGGDNPYERWSQTESLFYSFSFSFYLGQTEFRISLKFNFIVPQYSIT